MAKETSIYGSWLKFNWTFRGVMLLLFGLAFIIGSIYMMFALSFGGGLSVLVMGLMFFFLGKAMAFPQKNKVAKNHITKENKIHKEVLLDKEESLVPAGAIFEDYFNAILLFISGIFLIIVSVIVGFKGFDIKDVLMFGGLGVFMFILFFIKIKLLKKV